MTKVVGVKVQWFFTSEKFCGNFENKIDILIFKSCSNFELKVRLENLKAIQQNIFFTDSSSSQM